MLYCSLFDQHGVLALGIHTSSERKRERERERERDRERERERESERRKKREIKRNKAGAPQATLGVASVWKSLSPAILD